MKKIVIGILVACGILGAWFVLSEVYSSESQKVDTLQFEVRSGENVADMATRLEQEQVIRSAWLFKKYLIFKGIDKKVKAGEFEVDRPVTLARVAQVLSQPGFGERTITLIPGWNIRDFASYLETEGILPAEELTNLIGLPAVNYKALNSSPPTDQFMDSLVLQDKPADVSYEGYLAPDTYRIYKDTSAEDIVIKLFDERSSQFTDEMLREARKLGRSIHEIMTVASILEKEVSGESDRGKVADIFWRRYDINWALQADSTVHYAVGKSGDLFTTTEDRDSLSPWNTYRYPGLPPSPISNPSIESIMAAIYPEKNDYWYFLTTLEGEVKYAKTLDGHNDNRVKYLR